MLIVPASACAAGVAVAPVAAGPFVLLLAAVAVLPLVAARWWHKNRNRALVVAVLAVPTAGYMLSLGEPGRNTLLHELAEYLSFIVLLTALYVVSGAIVLRGDLVGRPRTNLAFLAAGAILANLIGTTGASMILIRPILRINSYRNRTGHIPVFFIFTVSNTGGLLTPLGDPPLFLGFLKGVSFFWTTALWREWLFVNSILLTVFYIWDRLACRAEMPEALQKEQTHYHRLRVAGLRVNAPLLALILLAVLFQSEDVGRGAGQLVGLDLTLHRPLGELVMLAAAAFSLWRSPRYLHRENQFAWAPMVEVAVLFLGIFVTMAPALALLTQHGPKLGITEPWQFFWLTGGLSSILDNAPTYVTFGTLAAGGDDFAALSRGPNALLLSAISCGAVFMGANSYIGNGPNFLVKAISEEAGYPMPTFFGYIVRYTVPVLVPVFVVVTLVFFQ
jgi:Na+/H+ antiporter NhaD/arsenite permease-like protein